MFDGPGVRKYPYSYLRSDLEISIMTVFSAKNTSSLAYATPVLIHVDVSASEDC